MKTQIENFNAMTISLFRAHHQLIAFGEDLCKPFGLSTAQWKTLGAIKLSNTPLSVPQIARNMGLTRQAVQRIANDLVTQNLIIEQDNPEHKRSVLFKLTNEGEQAFARINANWEKKVKEFLQFLSPDNIKNCQATLDQFLQCLEDKMSLENKTPFENKP